MTQSLSVSSQFADEEVKSSYEDPKGYKAQPTLEENLADIEKELKILREFPNLIHSDYDRAFVDQIRRKEVILPQGAERWTLIPRWQTLAPTYGAAIASVLTMIASKPKFYNYRDDQLGAEYLQQHVKTVKMFQTLGDEQEACLPVGRDHDIFVVPAQCGLGSFAVGIMLLTHLEREDSDFLLVPFFSFHDGGIKFDAD